MDVTDVVGGWGPWQKVILIVIIYRALPLSFVGIAPIFYVATTDHWCAPPDNIPWSMDEWRERAIPEVNGQRSKCHHFKVTFNDTEEPVVDKNITMACKDWEYEDLYGNTLTKQFNLVCDEGWKLSLTHTSLKLGNLIGFLPSGFLTDRLGRKTVTLWSFTAVAIFNLVSAFSPSYLFFVILRFFVGFGYSCAATPSLCLLLEVLGPDHRAKVSYSFIGGWGIGITLLSGLYWLDQDWRHSLLILTIPFTLTLLALIWRLVPESVRWLLTVKREDQAEEIIVYAAKKNKVELGSRDVYMNALKEKIFKEASITTNISYFDLFKSSQIRKWTLVFYLLYFLLGFVYFGFMMTIQALGANLFLTVFLMGVTEVVAVPLMLVISARFRRRRSLLVLSIVTAACYLAGIPVPNDLLWLRLLFSMLGRVTNIVIYNLIWMMGAEVFPTTHRSLGVNGSMTAGRIGTVASTFLVSVDLKIYNIAIGTFVIQWLFSPLTRPMDLKIYNFAIGTFVIHWLFSLMTIFVAQAASSGTWLLVLFGILTGLSSLLYLLLPETKDKHLPDTLAATKSLGISKKIATEEPKSQETL